MIREARELQHSAHALIRQNRFDKTNDVLQTIVKKLAASKHNEAVQQVLSQAVDDIVQTLCGKAFRLPAKYDAVVRAVDALQLQLSSAENLSAPYSSVPKITLTHALNALTSVNEVRRTRRTSPGAASLVTKLSFRILQRLITGVGVRQKVDKSHIVNEREINQVLNVFSNQGRMDMAHRIVALQERTKHAPPISPVAYSILLKGYGRQSDLVHVEQVLKAAKRNRIQPDIILLNTMIDAYINCNELGMAKAVFDDMRVNSTSTNSSGIFTGFPLPPPNGRTYNIILKGLANSGDYNEALELSNEMDRYAFRDPVTTNTLVRAAVMAGDFDAGERMLAEYTSHVDIASRSHPNVEAYTQLLDAYAKRGNMNKALAVIEMMRERSVQPNTWTYTCLIAGFGRTQELDEAKRLLAFMAKKGIHPSTVTYNALISAVLEGVRPADGNATNETVLNLDVAVDQSLGLLRDMMNSNVRPNSVTTATLVDAMGRCEPRRIESATLLVEVLEKKMLIPAGDARVMTALIRVCGLAGDMKRAVQYFRKVKVPDLVAINAFIDACHRCNRHDIAVDTFCYYFTQKADDYSLSPDVITYSVLITSALKNGDVAGLREAQSLYKDMKRKWDIRPDTGMVDTLLKAIIRVARRKSLTKSDVLFVAGVLRDAERLPWQVGQLERRRRAIRSILGDSLRDVFLHDNRTGSIFSEEDDELFKRKGWNKVDSGFRLWGQVSLEDASQDQKPKKDGDVDEFLESHGWNNVDSGFRIL